MAHVDSQEKKEGTQQFTKPEELIFVVASFTKS